MEEPLAWHFVEQVLSVSQLKNTIINLVCKLKTGVDKELLLKEGCLLDSQMK